MTRRSASTSSAGRSRRRRGRSPRTRAATVRSWRASCRSEEHTSELQSLMRLAYADFCLKKKTTQTNIRYMYYISESVTAHCVYIHTHNEDAIAKQKSDRLFQSRKTQQERS